MERIISELQGRRVIHYYLASTSASPLLAVVGTETRDRHYSYLVSENFLEVFGSTPAINALTKWTSRSDVMEWLNSFVRKDNLPPTNSNLPKVPTHEGSGSKIAIATSEPSGVQLLEQPPSHEGNSSLDPIAVGEPSGVQEPSRAQVLEPPREHAAFQVADNIELLSKDDDMHDCWYRCKILEIYKNCWKVQFYDRKNEGSGNVEEFIRAPRLAPPDNLSMRHSGRLNVRPCPPEEEPPSIFEVGAAVDAWRGDNWCEGFVFTGVSLSSNDKYHVFLPGPGKFLILHQRDLRASRDWVDDTWDPIKSHPDILSFLCSYNYNY